MPTFRTRDSYLTDARSHLAALIASKREVDAEMTALNVRLERLDRARAAIAPIQAEMSALDAAESAEMATWAETGGDTPPPLGDAAKRGDIARRLVAAKAAVTAADGATLGVHSQAASVAHRAGELGQQVAVAAANVRIDKLREYLPRLADKIAEYEAIKLNFNAGRESVIGAEAALPGEIGLSVLKALEAFDKEVAAPTAPADDEWERAVAARNAWASFADALTRDAAAKI